MARAKGTVTLVNDRTGAHWTCPNAPGLLRVVAEKGWREPGPEKPKRRTRKAAATAASAPEPEPAGPEPTAATVEAPESTDHEQAGD